MFPVSANFLPKCKLVTSSEGSSTNVSPTEDHMAVYWVELIGAQGQDLLSDSGKVGVKWNMKDHTSP